MESEVLQPWNWLSLVVLQWDFQLGIGNNILYSWKSLYRKNGWIESKDEASCDCIVHETCWKYVKSAHSILNHLQIRISFDQHHASVIKKYGWKLKKIFFSPSTSFAHSAQNEKQAEKPSQHHLTRKNVPMKKKSSRNLHVTFLLNSRLRLLTLTIPSDTFTLTDTVSTALCFAVSLIQFSSRWLTTTAK